MTQPRTLIVVDGDHLDEILGASGTAIPGIDSMSQPFLATLEESYGLVLYGASEIHFPAVVLTMIQDSALPPQTEAVEIDAMPPKGYVNSKAEEHIPQEGTSDEG